MSIIKATNLDLNKVSFSDVKTDNHGRKMVYVNYNGGKIMVQTPKMYVPNGIKRWRKKDAVDNKDDSFEMELSFGGEDKEDKNSLEIKEFHNKLKEFDSLVKDNIMARSKEWLGKPKVSMETIEDAYYAPSVKIPVDKDGNILEYPSRVRAKLDRERDGDDFTGRFLSNKRFKTPVLMFDEEKKQLDLDENNFESVVPKGSQVVCVLELVYLSITTKVSAKWKLVQGKVSRNQQSITGYALIEDDEVEVDDLDTDDAVNNVVATANMMSLNDEEEQVDEVDEVVEESEEQVEVELEVSQAPEPVKAKGRGKKTVAV